MIGFVYNYRSTIIRPRREVCELTGTDANVAEESSAETITLSTACALYVFFWSSVLENWPLNP